MLITIVVPGVLASALFVALTARARRVSLALLAVLTPLAALGPIGAYILYEGGRCGDACGTNTDWTDSPESWQWSGQLVVAAAGFIAVAAALALTIRGRYSAARLSIVAAALAFAGWAWFWAPLTSQY